MNEPILIARDLHKSYDDEQAVKGVSFDIGRGEIFSLLGPNGAGKTTTISMLSGLLVPTKGDAIVDGNSVTQANGKVKQVIGVVPQEIALYDPITARENLAFWGKMYGLGGQRLKERIVAMLDVAGLTDRADDKVETFSGGMKRRLNTAVGLLHEPKILFMDEPTVGIDPQSRRRILDTVKELNQEGLTVLYTTHYMEEAEELSDRIGILDHGKLIALGTLDELTKMVGEYDTISVALELDEDAEGIAKALQELPDVYQAYREQDYLVVQARDADTVLPAVITSVNQAGATIKRLEIEEPNLEAVFLHLTGRALRD